MQRWVSMVAVTLVLVGSGCNEDGPVAPDSSTPSEDATVPGRDASAPVGDAGVDAMLDASAPVCSMDGDCKSGFVCREGECARPPVERAAMPFVVTAGGGVATGGGHRLVVGIGAPTPMGHASDGTNRLGLGPISTP